MSADGEARNTGKQEDFTPRPAEIKPLALLLGIESQSASRGFFGEALQYIRKFRAEFNARHP